MGIPSMGAQPRQSVEPIVVADGDNGRGKRIRKESSYIRCIREGENTTTLPRGLQTVPEKAVGEEEAGGAWKAEEEDWAMAMVMDAAECLNPMKRQKGYPIGQNGRKTFQLNSKVLRPTKRGQLSNVQKIPTWSLQNGYCASKRMPPVKSRNIRLD